MVQGKAVGWTAGLYTYPLGEKIPKRIITFYVIKDDDLLVLTAFYTKYLYRVNHLILTILL